MEFDDKYEYDAGMVLRENYKFFDNDFLTRLGGLHLMTKRLGEVAAVSKIAGQRKSRGLGDGLEFADHRNYVPGDDVRFIDWAYYARMEKLLLRLFHEHSEGDVAILLDTSGSMFGERFDQARRIAAAMSFVAMCGHRRVVLQPFTESLQAPLRSGRNKTKILHVLDFLAKLTSGGKTNLSQCAKSFDMRTRGVSTVMLVSDFCSGGDQLNEALRILSDPRKHRDVTIFHIFSSDDEAPPPDGSVTLCDSETHAELELQITPQLRAKYLENWAGLREKIHRIARNHKAVCIPARSDIPFEDIVLRTLRVAKILS